MVTSRLFFFSLWGSSAQQLSVFSPQLTGPFHLHPATFFPTLYFHEFRYRALFLLLPLPSLCFFLCVVSFFFFIVFHVFLSQRRRHKTQHWPHQSILVFCIGTNTQVTPRTVLREWSPLSSFPPLPPLFERFYNLRDQIKSEAILSLFYVDIPWPLLIYRKKKMFHMSLCISSLVVSYRLWFLVSPSVHFQLAIEKKKTQKR